MGSDGSFGPSALLPAKPCPTLLPGPKPCPQLVSLSDHICQVWPWLWLWGEQGRKVGPVPRPLGVSAAPQGDPESRPGRASSTAFTSLLGTEDAARAGPELRVRQGTSRKHPKTYPSALRATPVHPRSCCCPGAVGVAQRAFHWETHSQLRAQVSSPDPGSRVGRAPCAGAVRRGAGARS